MYELCIFTLFFKMFYFRTFRKIRRSTTKGKEISAELFQCWKISRQFFRTDYLPQLFTAHNTSKYWLTLYPHVTVRNVRFSDFSPSLAVDVVETKKVIGKIVSTLKVIKTTFELIINHDCLLLTTRWNIDEICIGTHPSEIADFLTFRQVRRSTSSKRKRVSAKLFKR